MTLFVGNVGKNTSEDEITNFFTDSDVKVAAVRKQQGKGYALSI